MTWLTRRIRMWMCKHEWNVSHVKVWDRNDPNAKFPIIEFQFWRCTKCKYSKEVRI